MPYSLDVKKRKDNEKLKDLVPGVVYGPERKENILIEMDERKLDKAYDEAGESTLIDLTVEGEKEPLEVLIKDVQFDPVTDRPMHVDFYQIKRGQKIDTEVELEFVGEAPIEKSDGGIIVKSMDSIAIRCLPRDLEKVANLKIDLGKLKTFDDIIYVKDIELPAEVELMSNPDDAIVSVTEPREEEPEEAAPSLEEEMERVEVEGEGEGEAPAEGEAPTEGEAPKEEGKAEEKSAESKQEKNK